MPISLWPVVCRHGPAGREMSPSRAMLTGCSRSPSRAKEPYRSLAPLATERALSVIRRRTLQSVALVIVGAAILGWLIGRQVTRGLVGLTEAADDVAVTGRLDVEVPVSGSDETGRLGSAFNRMLGALARSRDQQHQLVQHAGHELRTPLTSLRTNVAVLGRLESLAPDARTAT